METAKPRHIKVEIGDTLTGEEIDAVTLKQLEQTFNTGPIIGESLVIIQELLRNLRYRDLILHGMGLDHDRIVGVLGHIESHMEIRDKEILEKRNANKPN